MKPPQSQPLFHFFLLLIAFIATISSSPLDPRQLKALKTVTTTKDPCNNHSSSTTITCDEASPFRHVTSLSFATCPSSSLSLTSKTLKPLSTSLLSLSFLNCPSLSPPKHLPISLHTFTAVSSFRRHGLSGVYLARLVNLTHLTILSVPLSASGLYVVLGNMRNITSLTISSSNLPGKIPKAFHSNLTHIDLSNNILTGPLRPSITLLTDLKLLNLSRNSLSGEIPDNIGDLTSLQNLSLAFNRFSGPIPSSVSSLSQLKHLDLSGNQLNGVVPSFFTRMESLRHLNLADNSFHGVLPFNASFVNSLEFFRVRGNSGLCYNSTVLSWKLNLGVAPCDKHGLPLSSPPQKEEEEEDEEEEEEEDYGDDGGDGDEKEEKHGSNKVVLGVAVGLSSLVFLIVFLILLARWSVFSEMSRPLG